MLNLKIEHRSGVDVARIQIIPLQIELCRGNSQPSHVSTVAQAVLQFLGQTTDYRGGIDRRHQADSIFGDAVGFQGSAIAETA